MRERTPALVVIAALVLAMLLLDPGASDPAPAAFGRPAALLPTADAADALSSTWFCAAGAAAPAEGAGVTVVVANASEEPRTGTVTWSAGPGERTTVPLDVPARGSAEVAAAGADIAPAPALSAVVELDGGEVAVEHRITLGGRTAAAPCASSASSAWYLANGTTARDASQQLVLFNPFPDDAVVDITLATDEGLAEPAALQGLPVVAGATEVIELADIVRRRDVTATTVRARSGRLVVERVQRFDGSEGRTGLSLTLAAPAPATRWAFPEGSVHPDLTERWHLYNPGDEEAQVRLLLLPDGEDVPEPEPVDLAIPPTSSLTVEAAELGRLAPGVAHSSTVRSTNGQPFVAERSLEARPPAAVAGWTSTLGAPSAAERWLLPVGGASGQLEEWVVVLNVGEEPVTASIVGLVGSEDLALGLDDISLAPGQRRMVRLRDHVERATLPLLVEASGPVVVERLLHRTTPGAEGLSSVVGVPIATSA